MSGESTATILVEEAIRGFLWTTSFRNPDKLTDEIMRIIEEHLGTDHFVNFDETGWFVEHSFACRVAGTLGTCKWGQAIRNIVDDEWEFDLDQHGRWRIIEVDSEGCPSLERVA